MPSPAFFVCVKDGNSQLIANLSTKKITKKIPSYFGSVAFAEFSWFSLTVLRKIPCHQFQVTKRRGHAPSDWSQNFGFFRFANAAGLSSPNSVAETALVSGTGFQPVADGERLGKNPPLGNCPSSVAALRRVDATEQAGCLPHYLGCRSAPEFGLSRGPATAIIKAGMQIGRAHV